LREWLTDVENGLLVNPRDPHQAAKAVIRALTDETFFASARQINLAMIKQRADVGMVSQQVKEFLRNFQ
jgi:glycosyltransferase involved in cell wall biosynthesis